MRYYKATLEDGISGYDRKFKNIIGLNVHPDPEEISNDACGAGLHIAKSIRAAMEYCQHWKEIYIARPGVILGEDEKKVRCRYYWLDRRLSAEEITAIKISEETDMERQKALDKIFEGIPKEPLCGRDWVINNGRKFTQDAFDKLGIVIKVDNRTLEVKAKASRKIVKALIKSL